MSESEASASPVVTPRSESPFPSSPLASPISSPPVHSPITSHPQRRRSSLAPPDSELIQLGKRRLVDLKFDSLSILEHFLDLIHDPQDVVLKHF